VFFKFQYFITMKKLMLCALLIGVSLFINAQNTAKDVFSKDDMVWYGLDFSKAKFIGQFDQAAGIAPATANDMVFNYIPAWNRLIVSETTKYDLRKTFRKTDVFFDLTIVNNNKRINEDRLMSFNDYEIENPNEVIPQIIKSYTKGQKDSGIGLVFIVEKFHKENQEASIYVTFFDIATKEVLFFEKIVGKARGIGLRNYWAGAVHNILTQVNKTYYNNWKKKYVG